MIALMQRDKSVALPVWAKDGLNMTGLMMIAYAVIGLDENTPFPGYWTLLPVIGTGLILAFSGAHSFIAKVLSLKPMVWIGLISYSAYLWHQPIFAFARLRIQTGLEPIEYGTLIGLTLLLSVLTWRFVEQPFRHKNGFTRRQVFMLALIFTVLLIGIGKTFRLTEGVPERFSQDVQALLKWGEHGSLRFPECAHREKSGEKTMGCVYQQRDHHDVVLLGDSHALTLTRSLGEKFNTLNLTLKENTQSGCAPILEYGRANCREFNHAAIHQAGEDHKAEIVILGALWPLHFTAERFDNEEGGVAQGKAIQIEEFQHLSQQERLAILAERLTNTIQNLMSRAKKVVMIYPIPEVCWDVPNYLARQQLYSGEHASALSTDQAVYQSRIASTKRVLDEVGEHPNLMRLYPEQLFCDTVIPKRCIAAEAGTPLYFDDNHLSSAGADRLSQQLVVQLIEQEWISP
jgi:hypothetical protein